MNLCKCGCEKEVSKERNRYIQGHNSKLNPPHEGKKFSCKHKQNLRLSHLGHIVLEEIKVKISKKLKGIKKPIRSKEHRINLGNSLREVWKDPNSSFNSKERSEKLRRWMLDGHAAYMNSFIKDPSKEQIELFKISCKVLPYPILNYPVFRLGKGKKSYNLDIADYRLGIAIEYDGYYHFCDQEHISYHEKRQIELEEEGWKFIRYNIFQKFPTFEQLKEDVQRVLKGV